MLFQLYLRTYSLKSTNNFFSKFSPPSDEKVSEQQVHIQGSMPTNYNSLLS